MTVEFVNPIVGIRFAKNGKIVKPVRMTVGCVLIRRFVGMQRVMVLKRVVLVLEIVVNVLHQILIVGMERVNTITMKTVCYAQKIVERVLHHRTLYVETVYVMGVKHVVIAQGIVQVHVNAWMEKFEMKPMCA